MKKHNEKEQEDLIRSVLRETNLETPSAGFTEQLLSRIEQLPVYGYTTSYTPLISGKAWSVIFLVMISLSLFAVFGMKDVTPEWISQLRLQERLDFSLPESVRNLNLPSALLYGLLAVTIYIYYQVMRLNVIKNQQNQAV